MTALDARDKESRNKNWWLNWL